MSSPANERVRITAGSGRVMVVGEARAEIAVMMKGIPEPIDLYRVERTEPAPSAASPVAGRS